MIAGHDPLAIYDMINSVFFKVWSKVLVSADCHTQSVIAKNYMPITTQNDTEDDAQAK